MGYRTYALGSAAVALLSWAFANLLEFIIFQDPSKISISFLLLLTSLIAIGALWRFGGSEGVRDREKSSPTGC